LKPISINYRSGGFAVAPRAGAWIETYYARLAADDRRRPPRGGVD